MITRRSFLKGLASTSVVALSTSDVLACNDSSQFIPIWKEDKSYTAYEEFHKQLIREISKDFFLSYDEMVQKHILT